MAKLLALLAPLFYALLKFIGKDITERINEANLKRKKEEEFSQATQTYSDLMAQELSPDERKKAFDEYVKKSKDYHSN